MEVDHVGVPDPVEWHGHLIDPVLLCEAQRAMHGGLFGHFPEVVGEEGQLLVEGLDMDGLWSDITL